MYENSTDWFAFTVNFLIKKKKMLKFIACFKNLLLFLLFFSFSPLFGKKNFVRKKTVKFKIK